MANLQKFFKGTVDDFNEYIKDLSTNMSEDAQKKYADIKNSVVYISENINEDPGTFDDFDGAVYAYGAIISSKSMKWDNTDVSQFSPK